MSREDDLGKRREDNKRRYWADPEKARARDRIYREKNDHGILPGQFTQMWNDQRGCCYLCGDELSRVRREVVIDHDHACCPPNTSCQRCRRGLACQACNRGIGFFRDDPARLQRVAGNLQDASDKARQRINAKPVQDELPINVRRMERKEESA